MVLKLPWGSICERVESMENDPILPPPKSHLVPAIGVTLFCCLPFGIPALIFAAQTDGLIKGGDMESAYETSAKAKQWCIISLICGIVFHALFTIMYLGLFTMRSSSSIPVTIQTAPAQPGTQPDPSTE
jgi:hypothetical protein